MKPEDYHWIIAGMGGAIGALAVYTAYLNKSHADREEKRNEEMRELVVENIKSNSQVANAVENTNKLLERFMTMVDRKK